MIYYLLKTVLVFSLLFGYYWLFLRNRKFHAFNRIYLLSLPALSFLLPLTRFQVPEFWKNNLRIPTVHLLNVTVGNWEQPFTIYSSKNSIFSWTAVAPILFGLISIFLLIRLIKNIRFLITLRENKTRILIPEAVVYLVASPGTPYSFFNAIYWDQETPLENEAGRQMLCHELFHVKQKHSLDLLYLEIISVFYWINPMIFFLRKEIQTIHEYAADEHAASKSDRISYASLLLQVVSGRNIALTNPFFKNQIKRRIAMMTKLQNQKNSFIGRLLILPFLISLAGIFSFTYYHPIVKNTGKKMRVVVDAGHGGQYTGGQINQVLEKNINLEIAKKIKTLSDAYQLDVILSRETDVSPGSNNLNESLDYVSSLAEKKNADVFISIHANLSDKPNPSGGFEIYIPASSHQSYSKSVLLGTFVTENIKPDYTIENSLKQRTESIRILDKSKVPALLIECGYMNNETDLKYMTDPVNQEKIARDILKGLRQYADEPGTITAIPIETNNTLNNQVLFANNSIIQQPDSPVYSMVDQDAEFPGGQKGWYAYLAKNMKYPDEAVSNEIQGTVIVEFIINKDGSLTDIHVVSGPEVLRKESLRMIKESGKWNPAKLKGTTVASSHKQPFNFKLEVSK